MDFIVLFSFKGAKRVIMVDNPVKFQEYIDSRELNLPSSTTQFEQDGKVGGDRGVAYTLLETLYLIFLLGIFGSLFDI